MRHDCWRSDDHRAINVWFYEVGCQAGRYAQSDEGCYLEGVCGRVECASAVYRSQVYIAPVLMAGLQCVEHLENGRVRALLGDVCVSCRRQNRVSVDVASYPPTEDALP